MYIVKKLVKMATKTKKKNHIVKSSRTRKIPTKNKINIYAKNMRFMNDTDEVKNKILLSELTNALKENQWLKYSNEKYKAVKHIDKNKINNNDDNTNLKPVGSYYSKGGWLFHDDMCCNLDYEIIFIEIDYKTVYRITGKEQYASPGSNSIYKNVLSKFVKKYGRMSGKNSCEPFCIDYDTEKECNNVKTGCGWVSKDNRPPSCYTINKCEKNSKDRKTCKNNKNYDCHFFHKYKSINWSPLYKKYNGFAIYPYPELNMMRSIKNQVDLFFLLSYDVETLVLWDHAPVIKYRNLGTIRDIIKSSGYKIKKNQTHYKDFQSIFIKNLIQKINAENT